MLNFFRKLIYKEKADSSSYIAYLKTKGYKIGENCTIYVPSKTSIDEPGFMIDLGDRVRISEGVTILCHDASVFTLDYTKPIEGEKIYYSAPRVFKKTIIGNNVFIGRKAIILMGTHIGDNVIIGAGSVVHGSVEHDSVYAGNPARRICSLKEFNDKCASQLIDSAKEYAIEMKKSIGRTPRIDEMNEGFQILFVKNELYPCFGNVDELIEYQKKGSSK